MKKQIIIKSLLLTISLGAVMTTYGCGNTAKDTTENAAATDTETSQESNINGNSSTTDNSESDVTDQEASNTEDSDTSEESSGDKADPQAIYQQFLDNELEFNGQLFSDRYTYLKQDFELTPAGYYYDVDEDGEDELLISTFYYGFDIYDVRDGELVLLDYGDGTADACSVFTGEGHTYVAHSDFFHAGRQVLTLIRYDENGDVVELISLSAFYEDSESDTYDENAQFSYNDTAITMAEYEEYMNLYQAAPVEDMRAAEIDESLFE
ncbi:hypothetical protein [Butyrivibrio fibrisolvens]|uniref:hypothetical protein n=1 Tax=Butyrivibrio fibrisolvens TaxID=831 RepID=UPI0004834108|nr:hypothetical protein [Butyrivibrio fibrisolvens]